MDVSADTADSSAASAPKKDSNSDEKQEQKSSLIDASPDTADSGAASASKKDASEPVGITPVSDDAITALVTAPATATATAPDATVPAIATATRSAPDYSAIIHPSIAEIIKLEELPAVKPLESLTLREMAELEAALQIGDTCNYSDEDAWKPDWGGNLLLYEKDVVVNKGYLINQPNAKPAKVKYCDWVASNAPGSNGLRGLELLLRFVYNMKGTPAMAKKILAHSLQRPAKSAEHRLEFIVDAISRVSYDPAVLQQDGWTIEKVDTPQEGEAFHIGRRIMWQRHEAIIIAFTPDETYGGLWKAAYVEDLETFDLEPGELQAAIKKWDNKQKQLSKKRNAVRAPPPPPSGSTRFAATANFTVDGIENGIILAVPTNRAAQGVLWPARVRHVVEGSLTASGGVRRNSSKNMIQVVFLAPFWNGQSLSSKVSNAKDPYSLGPLFEFDNIEVSEYNLQKYPFETISMEKIKGSFLFLSLPKGVFSRYLDSHRLAVALKTYAIKTISSDHASRSDDQVLASAQLIESHGLSLRTPIFPQVALTVPFEFILSKLPHPSEFASMTDDDDNDAEPAIDIDAIIRSMSPPLIFGKKLPSLKRDTSLLTPECKKKSFMSPDPHFTPVINIAPHEEEEEALWSTNKFASDFLCGIFQTQSSGNNLSIDGLAYMEKLLTSLIAKLRQLSNVFTGYGASKQSAELRSILCQCLLIKGHGEDSLEFGTIPAGVSKATIISEWRKACERIYKRAVSKLSSKGVGNDITSVITDSRCNGHVTQSGSFERPVRIPAAIKGARLAGAGIDPNVLLVTQVENPYLEIAENVVIPKAHKRSYIKRLKTKIASIQPNETGVPLTDDSEGEGGEDTMGSRGSYTAAIVGVAASIKAADMVVGGQCVNVFCAVRPPGHHAGQELRSMKAISNGFCLFNSAACAALYATTPRSQGGLGLRRVCIIDFDVHHGNGTQDILCPTFDPRFLYVSLHAGGAHINGYDDEDSDAESFRLKLGGKKQEGIFPGRCGDTSPHEGVLNIPLGQKVTASAMGTALVSQVTPAVEVFSPDLIILSAGFDAHMNDPLGMGGLTAEDFGSVTEVACQMAYKTCSGRIFSVLEGGYGVPCCQPRDDLFLPPSTEDRLLQLGSDLPANMKDDVPFTFRQKLDRCHAEGFLECVKEHVKGFVKCNKRK